MAIQKPDPFVWFSNGYNKMAAENCPVLGWQVPAEIDHWKPDLSGFQMFTLSIGLFSA